MQSQKCPQCKLVNFATAKTCKRCEFSMVVSNQTQPLEPVEEEFLQNTIQHTLSTTCPRCCSNDTQSYPMAYQSGTSFGNIKAASYTFNVGATVTGGRISNQTILASNLRPPSEPSSPYGVITVFISAFVAITIGKIFSNISSTLAPVLATIAFGLSFYFCFKTFRPSEKALKYKYQKAMAEWSKSWICLRCGASWML